METVTFNLSVNGKARREIVGGESYLVAPMTLIVPGVLPGSDGPLYYPPDETQRSARDWNGTLITVYHPVKNGKNVSASEPGVAEAQGVGFLRRSTFNGKLKAEGWFHVEDTRRVDPRVLEALEEGRPLELSTGLFVDKEPAVNGATDPKGRPYHSIARNYKPDHLAVLPDQVGACSIQDGCGVLVNAASGGWTPVDSATPRKAQKPLTNAWRPVQRPIRRSPRRVLATNACCSGCEHGTGCEGTTSNDGTSLPKDSWVIPRSVEDEPKRRKKPTVTAQEEDWEPVA